MKRRTDQLIAIGSVAAVAIVPTVLLAVVKVGNMDFTGDPGDPATTAAAGRDPQGRRSPTPKGRTAKPKGVTPQGHGTRPLATSIPNLQKPPPGPTGTTSYTRVTDVQVKLASGDADKVKETTKVVLLPKFALDVNAAGTSLQAGVETPSTSRIKVKGNIESTSTDGGKTWQQRRLTAQELARYTADSDPRKITYVLRSVPGVSKKIDALGSTHYQINLTLSVILPYLPKDAAAEITKYVPPETGVAVDLYADKAARPSWFSVAESMPAVGSANLVMVFRDYR
ncbi:hypothetical protein ACRYCC_01015 [Actinomadura scrupuli]|uniref:hypothetical protein n=1 Tax=Actinomadura scrupuli TaxID=559629 RepID=UPI003D97A1EE